MIMHFQGFYLRIAWTLRSRSREAIWLLIYQGYSGPQKNPLVVYAGGGGVPHSFTAP